MKTRNREYEKKQIIAAGQNTKERDYWLSQLSGEPVKSYFPYSTKKKPDDHHADGIEFKLSGQLFTRLTTLSSGSDLRLHVILVTGIVLLLDKYTGNKDIIIGVPTYKQEVDGELINTVLALRNQVRDDMTFKEFLLQVGQTIFEANENQNYPIETLLYKLGIPGSTDDFPLFDVAILLDNIHDKSYLRRIKLNTVLSFRRTAENVGGIWEYNGELYEAVTIERAVNHFKNLLQQVLADIHLPLSEIEILSEEEKNRLIFEFNDNNGDFSRDKTIYHFIETYSQKNPHGIAIVYEDSGLTYGQLNESADRWAFLLRKYGIGKDQTVGILLERSFLMAEGILAAWKAGGAYIPLDLLDPDRRIIEILEDSGTRVLLTQSEFVGTGLEKKFKGQIIMMDKPFPGIEKGDAANPDLNADMNRIAYIIYTSGSTGKPKGAVVEHIGMMNHIRAKINHLQINSGSTIAQNASHTFDISVWQFFCALTEGGKTVIYSNDLIMEPLKFIARVTHHRVTILEVVPSYLSVMLDAFDMARGDVPLGLHYLLVTGETIKSGLVKRWFAKYPQVKMVNAYGPTEASDDITHYIMDKALDRERIPIGKPLQNLNIYIVDEYMKLCPIGVKGEICVSGVGVGRGYLNDKERTGRVFMEDPFSRKRGLKLYKTGDLGTWLPDGTIDFFGRKDYQVKIRGFRIELGEIESKLTEHERVKEAVVIDRQDQDENKYLVAYIVSRGKFDISALKTFLAERLPEYMVPSHFEEIARIPLSPNGKINRSALPGPGTRHPPTLPFIAEDILKEYILTAERDGKEKERGEPEMIIEEAVISETEKKKILYEFNDTAEEYPEDKTIRQLFAEQVYRAPDNIALVDEDRYTTYGELNGKANRLAYFLRQKGVTAGSIVGLWVERSPETVIGILGILEAGAAYLPLGDEYPPDRLAYILKDSNPLLLVVQDDLDPAPDFDGEIIYIKDKRLYPGNIDNTGWINRPDDPAYIMYTSGSTGTPRGCIIQHNQWANTVLGWRKVFKLTEMEFNLLQVANFTFDVSAEEIGRALLNGGKLVICPAGVSGAPEAFYALIQKYRITLFCSTPAEIIPLMEYVYQNELEIDTLQLLDIGSDICPVKDFKKLVTRYGQEVRIVNCYGVTEAAITTTLFEESAENISENRNLPIGKPLPNMKCYILNNKNKLQAIGAVGELYIAGKSVGRGYLNRPGLTRDRFFPDKFNPGSDLRMYKTGDLARWLPDGNIEFLGRIDHQAKIKGIRIEPLEIENCLLNADGVTGAVIIAKEDAKGEKFLCAYVVAEKKLTEPDVREHIAQKLPVYMIPAHFIQLEKIPLLPNGKLNRRLLEMIDSETNRATAYAAPKTGMEKKVVHIWKEVLKQDKVGIHDNFFDIGGNSLHIISLHNRLKEKVDRDIPIMALFKYPTIHSFLKHIKRGEDEVISEKHMGESLELMEETMQLLMGEESD